ncbi:thiamine pyrophosphate-dependent enzyme [Spirillospora sp. CA-294931]|uniref:thiamine pyrophosphate-dependent enzyme n=1 Tax=Spirillospora sp. CA-294931 TaxID=3240042 RepID=UPI003D8D65A1
MRRIEALEILAAATARLPVVVTCAATSRELAAVADRPNHLYLLDAMGLAGSVATGVALGLDRAGGGAAADKVVAIEGDGSLLMNPNVLPTGGFLAPRNLLMVLLDNGVYASTAGLPTYSSRVDLGALAAASGWTVLRPAAGGHEGASPRTEAVELRESLAEALAQDGPVFLHVRIEPGNAPGVPKLLENPVVIARRFQDWLAARPGSAA